MKYLIIGILLLCFSCSNEKIVQLPEISHSNITEVLDVSPAYIFYNEVVPDSVEFNRKNIISTTNWLVNVDKRLSLKQAIPHIKYLQDKRRNAEMHKNDAAKNYFTCHDISINNLGFIEFTNVIYNFKNEEIKTESNSLNMMISDIHDISIITDKNEIFEATITSFLDQLTQITSASNTHYKLKLALKDHLTIQDYISIKFALESLSINNLTIDNNELIY